MRRDGLIILAAVAVAVASLSGAASLMPRINQMRAELQLTANDQVMRSLPPEIAFTQAALASLRGVMVDILWIQANRLKEEGRYYDAMQRAEWITKLQPRFPQVWAFHGWNMAYNVSVGTHTPQERWMWVQAGIKLIRDQGIPLNPNSILLYKELSWIFVHKIGQYSDDQHWFYKRMLALEWNELLGPPPEGTAEEIIDAFRPVAEAYEAYVNDQELTRATRAELERAIAALPRLSQKLEALRPVSLQQVDVRLRVIERSADGEAIRTLGPLRRMIDAQIIDAATEPLARLRKADPSIAPTLEFLASIGFKEPGLSLLKRMAYIEARRKSLDLKLMGLTPRNPLTPAEEQLQKWMDDPAVQSPRQTVVAFARARALHDNYHMNPSWMLELMEGKWFGALAGAADKDSKMLVDVPAGGVLMPLDWRHPGSHCLYWASLGVRKARGILRPQDFDILNTDRQVLMAIQQLYFNGKIIFDPASGYYRQLPDPQFIPAYELALYGSFERMGQKTKEETAAPEGFEAGHENFLISAIQIAYFGGEMEMAQHYYDKLRRLYLHKGESRTLRFTRSLADFVQGELDRDESWDSMDEMRGAVVQLVARAFDEGWSVGRMSDADRYLTAARRIYDNYQKKRNVDKARNAEQSRMGFQPFDDLVADVLRNFMTAPLTTTHTSFTKARLWSVAPLPLKLRVFDQIRETLYAEASKQGIAAAIAYPPPPGLDDYRKRQSEGPQPGPAPAGPLRSQDVIK